MCSSSLCLSMVGILDNKTLNSLIGHNKCLCQDVRVVLGCTTFQCVFSSEILVHTSSASLPVFDWVTEVTEAIKALWTPCHRKKTTGMSYGLCDTARRAAENGQSKKGHSGVVLDQTGSATKLSWKKVDGVTHLTRERLAKASYSQHSLLHLPGWCFMSEMTQPSKSYYYSSVSLAHLQSFRSILT